MKTKRRVERDEKAELAAEKPPEVAPEIDSDTELQTLIDKNAKQRRREEKKEKRKLAKLNRIDSAAFNEDEELFAIKDKDVAGKLE
jgi:hypothetical protein